MVQYCAVPCCKSSCKTLGISFHKFPSDEERRKQWEVRVGRGSPKLPVSSGMRVCSKHFLPSDYRLVFSGRKFLKETAVPSVFPFTKSKRKRRKMKCLKEEIPKKTVFDNEWMDRTLNPEFADWLCDVKDNNSQAYCRICCRTFQLYNMGRLAVEEHAKQQLHNQILNLPSLEEPKNKLYLNDSETVSKSIWYLTPRSMDRLLEIPKHIQWIKDKCNGMDFEGFIANYTLENIIKFSLFTEQIENRKSLFSLYQLYHVNDCFLVNKYGKVGCGFYRVLLDVLGETTLVHMGIHTRSLHNLLMDFIECAGFEVKGEADEHLLLFMFTRFVLKL